MNFNETTDFNLTKSHVCMDVLWLGLVAPDIERVIVSLIFDADAKQSKFFKDLS